MIVLDASALIDWLLRTSAGLQIEDWIYSNRGTLHAPHLLDLEVAQVLRRLVFQSGISAVRATEALQDLHDLRITRYPHVALLQQIWRLRANVSAYNAAYVALAQGLDATLLTCDSRLGSIPGLQVTVKVLQSWVNDDYSPADAQDFPQRSTQNAE